MSATDDGGPAFPVADTVHPSGQIQYGFNGMSLRDWFASQALMGMCIQRPQDDDPDVWNHRMLANSAYAMADAMLSARAQGKQGGAS
ncbi:MAG: hypothetical protein JSR30_00225 [Proteobacteria bacterium]|nr:hypothetical protein [Pseudomonadota bacterium]